MSAPFPDAMKEKSSKFRRKRVLKEIENRFCELIFYLFNHVLFFLYCIYLNSFIERVFFESKFRSV